MAVADVVNILMEYCEDGEETFRDRHGPGAVIAVQDIVDVLQGELGGQLDYDTLWSEFEDAPRETAPDLTGALEAMVEADPGLASKLKVLLEEYYAASRPVGPAVGEELPEVEASEFVPRGEERVEEQEAGPLGHTDEAGEGTYLYGNVPDGGDVTLEETLELGSDVVDVRRELEMLSFDVRELFEQLHVTVNQALDLTDEMREQLTSELEELEVELMLGKDAQEDRIVEHLRAIGTTAPGVLDLVLSGLRHTRTTEEGLVRRALRRVSGEAGEIDEEG